MQIKLEMLRLENFKGVKDKTYEFGYLTRINGMNRQGKTTIASAWYWLMSDKNYELISNPNIRPDDVEECIPTVTTVLDVDGKDVTLAKMQKRKIGKPDSNGISKVTITNSYEVNSVPKTERDFKSYLEDLGFSFDNFLACSHPNVFTGQKQADMRKVLFKMASEKSDCDIASISADTADVAKLFVDYKFEEIEAMNNASKKKAVKQVDAIPNQIVGLEKAKVDVDVAEQELAKADLERKITEIDKKISDIGAAVSTLQGEEEQLQFEMLGIMQTMNRELQSRRRELDNAKDEARNTFSDLHSKIVANEKKIADNTEKIAAAELKRKELGEQYKADLAKKFNEVPYLFNEGLWIFDENSTICSMCGQDLPADKIEQLRTEFEDRKAKAKADTEKMLAKARDSFVVQHNSNLEEIKAYGFKQKEIIDMLTAENTSLQTNIEAWKKQEQEAFSKQNELAKQLSELTEEADYSQNEEYVKLKAKHDEVIANIERAKLSTDDELLEQFEEEKAELIVELEAAKKIIALSENNIRIDEQIAELQEKQRDYEQAKADAEKILYQLSLVSKRKNELLVEEINQYFGIVKWILFNYQKNGEYKPVCIPEIDGKRFGDSTNTGREIEAKLDICNSFQKFFGMYCPIFLDGAESINDEYIPAVDTQLILLSVTTDKELKVEVSE